MSASDGVVESLREALRHSPENIPLRLHLGETLLGRGHFAEAEREFREALARAPDHVGLKLGLASAYLQQGKRSHALVVVEDLLKGREIPARVYLLHARLLLQSGDTIGAEAQYRLATEAEPGLADPELADRLQISPTTGVGDETESSFGFDLDEPEDRLRASWQPIPETQVDFEVERPDLSFRDVGGMEELKEEIRIKIIHPLAHPELYRAYGKSIGGGILLYGPPGCGKTHLARATAGEIRAKFISVGIHDVLDMWVGSSENRLHALFDQARGNRPCVLFFDEVDALAASRSDLRGAGNRALVNQFLSELDGVEGSNDGVLILAATNAPWHLDPAFRRPGRFDRILFVPPPDGVARAAILRVLCKGKPSQDVDFEQLGKKTTDFSGADLKSAIDLAIEAKLREAMQTGSAKPVTTRDLAAAIARVRPSTREWFGTAKNYALYANQGGLYDDILKHLNLKK